MRTCTRCGQSRPLTEFHLLRRGQEARQSRCKACVAQSCQERRQRDLKTARRNERERERGRVSKPLSPKHLEYQRIHARIRYQAHKPQSAARCAVRDAVRRAERWASNQLRTRSNTGPMIFRPPFCPWCGRHSSLPVEAHHYNGYDRQHRLSAIIWVCRPCHRRIDVLMREAVLDHLPAIEGFKRFLRDHGVQVHKSYRTPVTNSTLEGYNGTKMPGDGHAA